MKYGVTKKYALCFLIEALGLAGIAAEQEELGSNTIYFGDEVRPRATCTPHARAQRMHATHAVCMPRACRVHVHVHRMRSRARRHLLTVLLTYLPTYVLTYCARRRWPCMATTCVWRTSRASSSSQSIIGGSACRSTHRS